MLAESQQTLAQFYSTSSKVDDSIPPILELLRSVDKSFRPAPALNDSLGTTKFEARGKLRVEFLTPNRGSEELVGKPAKMPALGGASAEPLRFLDFLIYEPVRTVVLYKGGIPVLVPNPARFAIHKLIVAARRLVGSPKSGKDLGQSDQLIEALLATGRRDELVEALAEARGRGPAWREAIDASSSRMAQIGLKSGPSLLASA